jgi:acetyl-CoA acyltransferase 1
LCSTQKNPDDIVITLAIRTPLAKGKKGGFKDTDLDYIVWALLKEVVNKSKLDPSLVEDICLGNVCLLQKRAKSIMLRDFP